MARKYKWTKKKYLELIKGNAGENIEGLRSLAHGFDAADGYDLRHFEDWTPYQRRKVRTVFHRLEVLEAQPKRVIRARGANLEKLQESFHGGVPSRNLKVAFIPDTEPKLTLPGAKKHPPKVRMLKEGISIERPEYERVFIPFDQKALAKNARAELKRVHKQMPKAKLFFVQVAEYESVTGKSFDLLTLQVLDWMQKYDGKTPLPRSSGNRGDNPKHHHWKKWLNGLVGYVLPRHVDIRALGRKIYKGRQEAEELSRKRRNYMTREGKKRGRK